MYLPNNDSQQNSQNIVTNHEKVTKRSIVVCCTDQRQIKAEPIDLTQEYVINIQ